MKNFFKIGLLGITGCFLLSGCANETNIVFNEKVEYEINTALTLADLVKNKDEIELINGDDKIDTSKLGKKEVVIKYYTKKKKEKYSSLKIQIVDTIEPVIEAEDEFVITIGTDTNLVNNATATDNSGEDIVISIDGEYNLNAAGEYDLKFVANDSSGNKATKDFKLIVKNIDIRKYGYYVYKRSDSWHEVSFDSKGNFNYDPWWCPGTSCGGGGNSSGTYVIKGNKIIATITSRYPDDIGGAVKVSPPEIWTFTINSEKQVELDGQKFNWQKTFEG